jgi:hypothetical protein
MDQAQAAREPEQARKWEKVKAVVAVGEVVFQQVPADTASARTAGNVCRTKLGLPAMSSAAPSVERQ